MLDLRNTKLQSMANYDQQSLKRDVIAGLTLAVMLIPQGMAYALLAGLPPVMGLYASTIPLFIYALFASSKHLSVGPVAITSLLVFSGVSMYANPSSSDYISLVIVLAFMVGAIQLVLGIVRAGFIVKLIPHSVLSGYTSAAAIVIGISQLKNLIGIDIGNHLQIHLLFNAVFNKINEVNIITLLLGLMSIAVLILLKNINPRFPGALVVVVLSIIIVAIFRLDQYGVGIVGEVPKGFGTFTFPTISLETVQMLFPIAITISLIGFMESLSIAKAVARKEKYKIDPNKELKALGLSNMVGACFHSYPVNGSFSRTAVNHQSGGVSQFTSIITGVFIMITLFAFTSLFYYLPTTVLAAIIMVAVYKLVDVKEMRRLFKVKPFEGYIWLLTFIITLFVGIQWGIIMGAVFALVLLVIRNTQPTIVELGYLEKEHAFRDVTRFPNAKTLEEVLLIRIDSTLHFANVSFLEDKIKNLLENKPTAKWIIIDMSGVNDIDTISVDTIEEIIDYYQPEHGITMLFANMKGAVRDTVKKVGWDKKYKETIKGVTLEQVLKERGLLQENKNTVTGT